MIWFDRYLVLSEIGKGSGSTVYLVRHQKLGEYRAVKRIPKSSDTTRQIREAHILNHLKHPKIPRIYDIEEDDEACYIVEEYIEGESLEAVMLQSSFITLNFIYHTIMEVADILEYLHQLKPYPVIYQDLKAEHIMITKQGIRLIDFGIVAYLDDTGNKFQNFGTPEYCAPEKEKAGIISVKTDIYSLGKLLEAMINANGEKESQCLMRIAKKAAAYEADERYPTIGAFKKDLTEHMHSKKFSTNQKHLLKKIVVAGSQPHIGTTHAAIAMNVYLNQKNRLCIYKEENTSRMMRKALLEGGFLKEGGLYRRGNFLGMPKYGAGVQADIPKEAIEIMDFGSDIEKAVSEEADRYLLLTGSKEWEMEAAKTAYKAFKEKAEFTMIVNYGSSRIAKKYAAEYGRSIYCFPLDADPFYMTKEKEKLFERLLEQKGGGSEAEKCTKYWNCRKYLRQWGNTFIHSIGKLCSKRSG